MNKLLGMALLAWCGAGIACPPVDADAFWLPKDKAKHMGKLLAKAKKLNSSGQCALEGSFGKDTGKFYITVSATGRVDTSARILRFTLDELGR